MPSVEILMGLPASGKSTYARERVDKTGNTVRVNKDDLRSMMFNGNWTDKREKLVLNVRNSLIWSAMESGQSVVVDDTNLHPKHVEKIGQIVDDFNHCSESSIYTVEVNKSFLQVTPQDCVKRDNARHNPVGEDVIWDMYRKFVKGTVDDPIKPVAPPEWDDSLPTCIVCDIDGTVAIHTDRSPFDGSRVMEDLPNPPVIDVLRQYTRSDREVEIVFVSGRDRGENNSVEGLTREWIKEFIFEDFELFMRAYGDNRKDSVIKREIYFEHIENKYNVLFVLDDRNSTVQTWRELGLTCFQVAPGDF